MAYKEYNNDKLCEKIYEVISEQPKGNCIFCNSENVYKDNMCHKHFTQFNFFKHIWHNDLDECVREYILKQMEEQQ